MANFPSEAAFRDYVESHKQELLEEAFLSFSAAQNMMHIPDNKGKKIVNKGSYSKSTFKKWKKLEFTDFTQKGDLRPIEVESHLIQHLDSYTPTQLEQSWIGERRKRGQDPQDFPFLQFFVGLAAKSIAHQSENLLFQSTLVPASTEGDEQYDAILAAITAAITATTLTVITGGTPWLPPPGGGTPPGGSNSIIDILEDQYDSFDEEQKAKPIKIFLRPGLASMYNRAYRNVHRQGATIDQNLNRVVLDASLDYAPATIIPSPGMGASNRIIMVPEDNIYYTYDMAEDSTKFNFQFILNTLYMWSDFRIGSGILDMNNDEIKVNELT